MKRKTKPNFRFTDKAERDIDWCRAFLRGTPRAKPAQRIREIQKEARRILDSPKLYPVEHIHPVTGLEFRRKNVGQFAIIYAFLEPTPSLPEGEVSIRAIHHGAKEDVMLRVEEPRLISANHFPRLRTGHVSAT
jgi:plasmid stabilization system protein ParE